MTAAMSREPGFVASMALAWVRIYCAGMTDERRAVRRLEIESDLWEQRSDQELAGMAPAMVSVEVLSRLLRGVPSDIAWRFQAEGFHMNIQIPVERFAGALLLFLIVPFIAGASIAGYDSSRDAWPSEFQRFSGIGSNTREVTALLHGLIGVLAIIGAASMHSVLSSRSPKLIGLGAALISTAGIIMVVNAAIYATLSSLADDHAASPDPTIVTTARSFMTTLTFLAQANFATTILGVLCTGTALVRLALVPRWTRWMPVAGVAGGVIALGSSVAVGASAEWMAWGVAMMTVFAWLLVCGLWLLLGGGRNIEPLHGAPAPV